VTDTDPVMTAWPTSNKPADFAGSVEPLARWFRLYQEGRVETYDGLPLGAQEAAGSLQPVDALTQESLAYNLTNQGRDVIDVILGLAVQLGIEQGRRLLLLRAGTCGEGSRA
jgi:hypothetical protein